LDTIKFLMNMKKILSLFCLSIFSCAVFAQSQISLEDIWKSPKFSQKSVYGWKSLKNGIHYTTLEGNATRNYILKYDFKSGKLLDTVITSSKLRNDKNEPFRIESYTFNQQENKLLISSESESIYRHSSKASFFIYDLATGKTTPLSTGGKQMLAEFNPQGDKVAFVRDNNIFYRDLKSGNEIPVTKDGRINRIINGASDWVYEEEFSFDKAWQWSPDGMKIAFYRFDETQVPEFEMPLYGTLYPGKSVFKYPKAGEKNSEVNILIYSLADNKLVMVDTGKETDQYIPRIKWTNDPNKLSIIRMNRLQNHLELMMADAASGKTSVVYQAKSDTYIDIHDHLHFLNDNQSFVFTHDESGFLHIYRYSITDGKLLNTITSGNFEVMDIKGIDDKNNLIYFTSNEHNPLGSDLYSVSLTGSGKKRITTGGGNKQINFSSNFDFYLLYHSEANSPLRVSLHSRDGKEVRVLEENKDLRERLKSYPLAKKEFMTIQLKNGVELNAWMMKPSDFSESKKYPVYVAIYGGPGHNTVVDQWDGKDYMWHQMLCQKGYIVVSVDNRGTGRKGAAFKKSTYKNLGNLETNDQIDAAKYLGSLPYVDKSRIGIQGWSFGGYLSSLCISKGADVFKAAIAVAPVTSWRYYDSIYTERYLQTPQQNASGYDSNSPINHVDKLKGAYLLVHGTADDNVHFQNTVEMTDALIKAGKQFELAMYPDKNHGIGGAAARYHLYTKMLTFIEQNL
jgi:dipeptidyl-peptidase 4